MLAHLAHHLVTALPVPLLPFIRDEFALDYTRAGLVISAFGIVYGASQLPAGWLADRIGARLLISAGIIGVAVTGLLVGLSQTYLMLIIFLVLIIAVFYFLLIRPQRKKQKEQRELMEGLKKGDKVITAGGIFGSIESVSEDSILIKVESGATMRVAKNSVAVKRD